MVVADFDDEPRLERLPFCRSLGRPAAGTARLVAGKARRGDQLFELFGQRLFLCRLDGRGESNVMQQPILVIKTEQQRADDILTLVVAKTTDDAVSAAIILDLLHAAAVARAVFEVAALGDDAVEGRTGPLKPLLGLGKPGGCGRKLD